VDDNPAERALVAAQLPSVAVPEVGENVTRFAAIIEQGRYFEPISLSKEDLERAALYAGNVQRTAMQSAFANYGDYLDSLEMTAEIDSFKPVYLERIAQLTNKTNQFNLTTRRYTLSEMESMADDPSYLGLYGRLVDRLGDNGLVSVVLGHCIQDALHIDLWLMSCRVLKRDMEFAMLDTFVDRATAGGIKTFYGYYLPTKKNGMVAGFYPGLGFQPAPTPSGMPDGATVWTLDLSTYERQNTHIKILEKVHA
jgi:FkbH-like protein